MNDSDSSLIDADDVFAQAAGLAAHLQRVGVAFLPLPNAERVEVLLDQFRAQDSVAVSDEPVTLPAEAGKPVTRSAEKPDAGAGDQFAATQQSGGGGASLTKSRLATVPAFDAGAGDYAGEALSVSQRAVALQELSEVAGGCEQCEVLSSCRKNVVFGEGNPGARFLFFGEGPGADEDRTGRPFIGKAGQLLTKMIAACTLDRDQCYITNTVKCRPPGNRNPEHDEIENCRSFYEQQMDLIRPEYIVCLGAIAASELLRTKLSVGRLRGKLHQYRGSKVLVTYHPAYLLRNPAAKKAAWQDLQFLMADAGIELP